MLRLKNFDNQHFLFKRTTIYFQSDIEVKHKRQIQTKEYSKIWSIFVLVVFMILVLHTFLKWPLYDFLLQKYGKTTSGKIVSETGYNGKGGHILREEKGDDIVYQYSFRMNNKNYFGDSQSSDYNVNDTINIVYLESFPRINRPKYYLYK